MIRQHMRFGDRSKYGKRHKPGEMNKTEGEYAAMLEARKIAGEIIEWSFETITLKLADNTRYTPDFVVVRADGVMELIDVKGGGPIDPKAIVKIKVAAERFWMFAFAIEQKQAKKNGGGWKRTDY